MSMSTRTFYIELDGGILDTDISSIRRRAIDHLWQNPDDGPVTVYTSASKKVIVGRVARSQGKYPFIWTKANKRSRPLDRNGSVYKHKK